MEIKKYINQLHEFYELIISFCSSDDEIGNNKESQIKNIFDKLIHSNEKEEFCASLKLLSEIFNNHHRSPNFCTRIEQILQAYSSEIKQTFTNLEIFQIFKNNKLVLLFLFEEAIIKADETILPFILEQEKGENEKHNNNYEMYFFPEIKNVIDEKLRKSIETELARKLIAVSDSFKAKRKKGENDNYMCELIRKDSVDSLVSYIKLNGFEFNDTKIKQSFFETNPFLISKEPTLIEYAAFFGSIKIFQLLLENEVELTPSLWIYAVHSNNIELFHILQSSNVEPPSNKFSTVLKEAIKCHHNDLVTYIIENLINEDEHIFDIENDFNENIYSYCFQYMNYSYFKDMNDDKNTKYIVYYGCKFDYYTLVQFCLRYGNININEKIVQT